MEPLSRTGHPAFQISTSLNKQKHRKLWPVLWQTASWDASNPPQQATEEDSSTPAHHCWKSQEIAQSGTAKGTACGTQNLVHP